MTSGMRILVVDDDPDILRLCKNALERLGHDVTTCIHGEDALQKALSADFDVALCDLALPDVSGVDIIKAIKKRAPQLPVIVISALDPREWGPKTALAGADFFLQKPLRLDVLRDEVTMAGASRGQLVVALQDDDPVHRAHLETALRGGGCTVRTAQVPMQIMTGAVPDLIIVDGSAAGAEAVVRWAGVAQIHCFVLLERGKAFDERLMRKGASLVVHKPVDPEALLIQARFLAR